VTKKRLRTHVVNGGGLSSEHLVSYKCNNAFRNSEGLLGWTKEPLFIAVGRKVKYFAGVRYT
jgi:hypothetical protein